VARNRKAHCVFGEEPRDLIAFRGRGLADKERDHHALWILHSDREVDDDLVTHGFSVWMGWT
jgi:hypothetical protein